jgi:glutamine synthetase
MEENDNSSTTTTARTIWSETLLEILYESLQHKKSDESIREILRDLRKQGMKPDTIIREVAKNVDEQAIVRVMGLLMKKFD